MDYTPTFGWYYIAANRKAPAWTGVVYLFNYLTREHSAPGPAAESVPLSSLLPGDVVQLSFDGVSWAHTGIVVEADKALSPRDVLIAAHSEDADFRISLASTLPFQVTPNRRIQLPAAQDNPASPQKRPSSEGVKQQLPISHRYCQDPAAPSAFNSQLKRFLR